MFKVKLEKLSEGDCFQLKTSILKLFSKAGEDSENFTRIMLEFIVTDWCNFWAEKFETALIGWNYGTHKFRTLDRQQKQDTRLPTGYFPLSNFAKEALAF